MSKKSISFIGFINIDVPPCKIFVVVNKTKKQIEDWMATYILPKGFKEEFFDEFKDDALGFYELSESGHRWFWFKELPPGNDSRDTLNHEVVHFVDFESKHREFTDEMEFKAYLHEAVFKKMRDTLNI